MQSPLFFGLPLAASGPAFQNQNVAIASGVHQTDAIAQAVDAAIVRFGALLLAAAVVPSAVAGKLAPKTAAPNPAASNPAEPNPPNGKRRSKITRPLLGLTPEQSEAAKAALPPRARSRRPCRLRKVIVRVGDEELDGTAKGGTLAAVAAGSQGVRPVPVYWIGVGEGMQDLQPFVASEFAAALLAD